jgi:hypothetical protein
MKMVGKNTVPKVKAPGYNRRLEPALGLGSNVRGDPDRTREYVSHTDPSRFSVIGQLESSVSMLQTAWVNIEKLKGWLQEMKTFLEEEGYQSFRAKIPVSVINNFLSDRIAHMKMTAETASFQDKALLNGKSGVRAEVTGDNIQFVRGSPKVLSSDDHGYPLAIYQSPSAAILTGTDRLTYENISDETMISVSEGSQEIRYQIRPDEDPDSLVAGLQQTLLDHGMDISVFRTTGGHLLFRHNQLGSVPRFKGMSYQTRLVSSIPGRYLEADLGKDVTGTIGSEQAKGDGGYLIGSPGNRRTDGLVIYYDGAIDYPGQIMGYIWVEQNGTKVPLTLSGSQSEILSLPALQPELLATGVSNRSGFISLDSIQASTVLECRDAIKLILWSMTYLDYLAEELRKKENNYVERAVELLRSTMTRETASEAMMVISKEKAQSMASQLKNMVTPAMMSKVTRIG